MITFVLHGCLTRGLVGSVQTSELNRERFAKTVAASPD